MKRNEIIKLSKKNIDFENLEKAKNFLQKEYEISFGDYSVTELKKAIDNENPVIIENNLLIGYNSEKDGGYCFVNHFDEKINIDKMTKAIIVEDIKIDKIEKQGETFLIPGRQEWNMHDNQTNTLFSLKIGEIFLPPHSAILNLLVPSEEIKRQKIVSMLHGVNINVYEQDNAFDNIIHEIGHLFWRTCLLVDEKIRFKRFFDSLKPSALYNFSWEKKDEEETFCTIYKWYVKSILINKSFYNILEHEEPKGLELLKSIFDRIAKERMINDIFEENKEIVFEYLHPRLDSRTGRYIIKKEIKTEVEKMDIPLNIVNDNIEKVSDGIEYINLGKAVVPIHGNRINCELFEQQKIAPLHKASNNKKQIIYFDMDGVVADFSKGYKECFNRDAYKDDSFTVSENCITKPDFFRNIPLLEKGFELYELLKNDYQIVFLTTPMNGIPECRRDKINWIEKYFGKNNTIIFSSSKEDYVVDEKSILIDDMNYNLIPWDNAGGTAINFNQSNDKIINRIKGIMNGDDEIIIKKQLDMMEVNTKPTEAQKESGNYKKGEIIFKGIKIKIENPKGSFRFGIGEDGKKWIMRMKAHYGYIVHDGDAIDGDKIDVFVGPKLNASRAFVVNQKNPWTGMFDEHKIILGVETIDEAEKLYFSNYQKGWLGLDSIKTTNTKQIREWLKEGKFNEPF